MVGPVAVGSADRVVLVESHKEGKVREESLVQVEDTSLVERRKACQGNQDQEDHLDPNYLAEEHRTEGTQDVDRKEGREEGREEDHAAAAAAVVVVAVVVRLGELGEQIVVGFDVEGLELELALPGEDESRSAWKIDQQAVQNMAIKINMCIYSLE